MKLKTRRRRLRKKKVMNLYRKGLLRLGLPVAEDLIKIFYDDDCKISYSVKRKNKISCFRTLISY